MFQTSPLFERSVCFYVTISRNFERFQYFNLETNFRKTKHFFKKLEHRFLVQSTKIENASFPYKTAISVANVKKNRMVNKKETYKWIFASKYPIFFENFVSAEKPLKKSWFDISTTQMSIFILFVSAGVLFEGDFSLWVSLICFW